MSRTSQTTSYSTMYMPPAGSAGRCPDVVSRFHFQGRPGALPAAPVHSSVYECGREPQADSLGLRPYDTETTQRLQDGVRGSEACADGRRSGMWVTDFESAVWNALREVFGGVRVLGCAFHWAQAVWRKAQDLGLATAYINEPVVSRFLRLILALPFLPAEHIRPTCEWLYGRATLEPIAVLLNYVRDTWLVSSVRDVRSWSVYRRSIRTNNDVKGWHHRLNAKAGRKLPFYRLLHVLHQEADSCPYKCAC